jgi:hypothetical protein
MSMDVRMRSRRARYAAGLERAVRAAHEPAGLTAAIPVQRGAVAAARGPLLELASALRSADAVPPVALAGVRRLLTDCTGPLFAPAAPGALRAAALAVLEELDDGRDGHRPRALAG